MLFFVAFCMEAYKNEHKMSGKDVSLLFDRHKVKEYLFKHYDILHTQGMPWILEEIEEKIKDETISRKSSDS